MRQITIGVDYRPALSKATGVGRYFQGLMAALGRLDRNNDYLLFSSSWKERPLPESRPANFRLVDRRIPVRVLNALWHRVSAPSFDWLVGADVDIAHSPTPLILPSRHGRSIVTICDLFFLERPEATRAEIRRDYVSLVRAHVQAADAIVAISDTTARDVRDKLDVPPERISVIHAGLDERFASPANGHHSRKDYLLAVATLEPRKNIPTLLEAVAVLRRRGWEGRLRIAGGPGLDAEKVGVAIERLGLGAVVETLGYVDRDALRDLYQEARALVMPSLWEGFGLPLLEAMASGTPIVASDIPVHREVAGEAALFADPREPQTLADAVEQVWSRPALVDLLISRGRERVRRFTWERSAEKTLALYRRLMGVR